MVIFGDKNITIQEINETVIEDIYSLHTASGLSHWTKKDYQNEITRPDTISLIATFEGKLVGFIIMRVVTPIDAEVYNIAVDRNHRRNKIGKRLLSSAILKAISKKNIKQIWLEVRQTNYSALNFYQNFGFTVAGHRKNFYNAPPEDALLMKLEVDKLAGCKL